MTRSSPLRSVAFVLDVPPQTKPRPRLGKGRAHNDARYRRWKSTTSSLVAALWVDANRKPLPLLRAPCRVDLHLIRARPQRRPATVSPEQWAHGRRIPYTGTPDLDNWAGAVLDAMNGTAIEDDRLVVQGWWRKSYAMRGETAHVQVVVSEVRPPVEIKGDAGRLPITGGPWAAEESTP